MKLTSSGTALVLALHWHTEAVALARPSDSELPHPRCTLSLLGFHAPTAPSLPR